MKKFASLLLAFAMTVGMLTGCGGDSGTSSTGEAPAQEVTVAISSTFATLDPALISTTHMAHVYGNMGSNFYRTDANGVLPVSYTHLRITPEPVFSLSSWRASAATACR